MPSFTFYGGRKQERTKFSRIFFLFPNFDKLLNKALCEFSRNSTPGEFAYIWQSERAGIIAMKFEKPPVNLICWTEKKKRHTCLVPLDRSRICASLGNFQVMNAALRICFFFSSLSYLYTLSTKSFPTTALAQSRITARTFSKLWVSWAMPHDVNVLKISSTLGIFKSSITLY